MRAADLPRFVEAVKPPMRGFVRESRVRIALLIRSSGQVLAQHGFTRSYEVMNVASLAASAHASSRALGHLIAGRGWDHLYQGGQDRSLFLAPLQTGGEELIVIAIFDRDSSLGIVQFFFDKLAAEVTALPEFRAARGGTDQASFERDLEAGLRRVGTTESPGEG